MNENDITINKVEIPAEGSLKEGSNSIYVGSVYNLLCHLADEGIDVNQPMSFRKCHDGTLVFEQRLEKQWVYIHQYRCVDCYNDSYGYQPMGEGPTKQQVITCQWYKCGGDARRIYTDTKKMVVNRAV